MTGRNCESWHIKRDLGVVVDSKHENKSESETEIIKMHLTEGSSNLLPFFEQLIHSKYRVSLHLLISIFCILLQSNIIMRIFVPIWPCLD